MMIVSARGNLITIIAGARLWTEHLAMIGISRLSRYQDQARRHITGKKYKVGCVVKCIDKFIIVP